MTRKINVLKHVLVPKHVVLSEDEAKYILERLGVKRYELPVIFASDPAARAVGAKPGDVIMVIRESPTAGRSIAFRQVVEG